MSVWFCTGRPATVVQPFPSGVTSSTCCQGHLLETGKSCLYKLEMVTETLQRRRERGMSSYSISYTNISGHSTDTNHT